MKAGWGFSRVVDIFEAGLWCARALVLSGCSAPERSALSSWVLLGGH